MPIVVYFLEFPLLAVPSLVLSLALFGILRFFLSLRDRRVEAAPESPGTENLLLKDIVFEMEDCQLFLRKGLTLTELSQLVASNRSYVSGCINANTGMSFSDFVNSYRVEYAKALLLMNEDGMSIGEIRDRSGFETESTFIRNFHKFVGMSPSEWQRVNKRENS